jgi:ABC-type hemin transport system ATPase subunit
MGDLMRERERDSLAEGERESVRSARVLTLAWSISAPEAWELLDY